MPPEACLPRCVVSRFSLNTGIALRLAFLYGAQGNAIAIVHCQRHYLYIVSLRIDKND